MGGYCLIGTVFVWNNEKVLELDGGKFIQQQVNVLNATELYT